jgi:hypothetical protein
MYGLLSAARPAHDNGHCKTDAQVGKQPNEEQLEQPAGSETVIVPDEPPEIRFEPLKYRIAKSATFRITSNPDRNKTSLDSGGVSTPGFEAVDSLIRFNLLPAQQDV